MLSLMRLSTGLELFMTAIRSVCLINHRLSKSPKVMKCAVCLLDTPSFRHSQSADPIPKRVG
jgi:hypothetical protein